MRMTLEIASQINRSAEESCMIKIREKATYQLTKEITNRSVHRRIRKPFPESSKILYVTKGRLKK